MTQITAALMDEIARYRREGRSIEQIARVTHHGLALIAAGVTACIAAAQLDAGEEDRRRSAARAGTGKRSKRAFAHEHLMWSFLLAVRVAPNVPRAVAGPVLGGGSLTCPAEGLCWRSMPVWANQTSHIEVECLHPAEHAAARERAP